jgi:transmembrane sensor
LSYRVFDFSWSHLIINQFTTIVDKRRINHLLKKYIEGYISEEERRELLDLYRRRISKDAEYPDARESVHDRIWLRLNKEIHHEKKSIVFSNFWKIGIAAASVIVVFAVYILICPVIPPKISARKTVEKQPILPGTNMAILTLGNGKKILLNRANTGRLAVQGGTLITKNASGQISYQVVDGNKNSNNKDVIFNTITTPMGGQFKVTLPDGSNVWLNASSSLTYPSVFEGTERHVQLHGEAYFEVFKNKNMPFTVTADNTIIKVLGTHFNVMAYANEPCINTTLLEGSIALTSKYNQVIITPGQQAVVYRGANKIMLKEVDVENEVAWKNGYFSFENESVQTVMNKISRWYNVEIEYQGNVSHKIFGGTVSRTENITELLNYLKLTGIAKFQIEGRRIIVTCK